MAEEKDRQSAAKMNGGNGEEELHHAIPLGGLYESWFLDYASYVILDRAVPHVHDGLKPVQRRIMHSLKEMDDGRYNKVANVIGNTMKYHPHGDVSIGDAMVQLGQKDLLIDTQGNWGDPITGDSAAAFRYIEARLSKFAIDVVFNPQTTLWQLSYDGRNQEPVTLPVKFPLVLAQGADGIAVGLATKVLPHNFNELIDASVNVLKGKRPGILPDFPTGGIADFSKYNEGLRGGRVRVRARIVEKDKKTLLIKEIPYGTTTTSLIDSIIAANEKGKIKIKKIEDNTAGEVEIAIHLASGISPDLTIDALYAFTDCEVSISPNACVIRNDKPAFMSVNDILSESTHYTRELLKQELEIKLGELQEKIFFGSLLKIFIQEGMYKHRDYEGAGSFEVVVDVLNRLFEPFFSQFYREILPEDYKKLIDKPMSSITRFDLKKADEQLLQLEEAIKEVRKHLKHLTDYAISWFLQLKEKYGKGRERRTQIREFESVQAAQVALSNVKFYVNRADGFVGTGLRRDEYLFDCSDLDNIIVFRSDGKCLVTKVADKTFVGKDIIHVGVYKKADDRTAYNMIYRDGQSGKSYIKRFHIGGVTRDKEYDLTKGTKGTRVLYFTENPNGEAEVVSVFLRKMQRLRKLNFDADFAEYAIKGRSAQGNIITKYPIRKVELKEKGISTLSGRKIWFDETVMRLNADGRGRYLGEFEAEDKITAVYKNGYYELTGFDLTTHFDEGILVLEKYDPDRVYAAVHYDGKSRNYYVKRFKLEDISIGKKVPLIGEEPGSKLTVLAPEPQASDQAEQPASPVLAEVKVSKGKSRSTETIEVNLSGFIDVKGMKAMGNKLSPYKVQRVKLVDTGNSGAEEPGNGQPSGGPEESPSGNRPPGSGNETRPGKEPATGNKAGDNPASDRQANEKSPESGEKPGGRGRRAGASPEVNAPEKKEGSEAKAGRQQESGKSSKSQQPVAEQQPVAGKQPVAGQPPDSTRKTEAGEKAGEQKPTAGDPAPGDQKVARDTGQESGEDQPENPPQKKEIDFEITNKDDVDIDDEDGQLGLF